MLTLKDSLGAISYVIFTFISGIFRNRRGEVEREYIGRDIG